MASKIPCECGCFDYHHIPEPVWNADVLKDTIARGECIICNDCMLYRPLDNLSYLEYEATRQKL